MAEIHKCGPDWAYCDGNCATCAANNQYTTTGGRRAMTNADRYFRNLTDEEIKEGILAWLKQEAPDEG